MRNYEYVKVIESITKTFMRRDIHTIFVTLKFAEDWLIANIWA
jgi:hypothetical protein